MGIGQLGQEVEIFDEVGGGIAQGGEDEDALFVAEGSGGGRNGVEVNTLDGGRVDLVGLMMVEEDRGLEMLVPGDHFVIAHFDGRFGRAKAVETVGGVSDGELLCRARARIRQEQHTLTFVVLRL